MLRRHHTTQTQEGTTMTNNVELAAEIAGLWLEDKCSAWATVYREDPNGDVVYVDAAQEMFNALYDDIYNLLEGNLE